MPIIVVRPKDSIMRKYLFILIMLTGVTSFAQKVSIEDIAMKDTKRGYGIEGQQAPELSVAKWIDASGEPSESFQLSDYDGKFKVLYCFQAWCPGCHSIGLPSLQKMTAALKDSDKVVFAAIQTVFEGKHANTYDRMVEIQKEYDLEIPFGHDLGAETERGISSTMQKYRTGGTPWFILIDESGKVVFNDFHLNTEKTIEYLKQL
jgi:peroxiredoxin